MRLLIYEHATGGGLTDGSIPSDVLCEGFGMLSGLISDFKTAGHHVTVFLNSRLAALNPPLNADSVIPINSLEEAKHAIEDEAESFDAAYIIGPETNQIMQSLITSTEEAGLMVLNSSTNAIDQVANKLKLYHSLKRKGIRTPETTIVNTSDDVENIELVSEDAFDYPMVIKPLDGVGCSGLSIVVSKTQIPQAIAKIRKESAAKSFIVQEYIRGIPASVSLISTGYKALPISLNKQTLLLSGPEKNSSFKGGLVPFFSNYIDEAFRIARETVEPILDLKGYIGVDLVLTERGPVVVEVNPRLTTSYVGLRRAVNINIGKAILDAVLQKALPENVEVAGYSIFSKIEVPSPPFHTLQKTYGIEEIVSPPFALSEENTHALICCYRSKLQESVKALRDAENLFLKMLKGEQTIG